MLNGDIISQRETNSPGSRPEIRFEQNSELGNQQDKENAIRRSNKKKIAQIPKLGKNMHNFVKQRDTRKFKYMQKYGMSINQK